MCARRACKHDEEHTHKYISLTGTTYERMVTNNPVFWRKKNIISNDTRLSCVYVQNTRDTNLELPSDTQPCVYVIANSCCFFKYTCTARQSSVTYTVWCRTPYDAVHRMMHDETYDRSRSSTQFWQSRSTCEKMRFFGDYKCKVYFNWLSHHNLLWYYYCFGHHTSVIIISSSFDGRTDE